MSEERDASELEGLLEGVMDQTLVNTSLDDFLNFLDAWVEDEVDREEAEQVLDLEGVAPRPEEVIESLEKAREKYDVIELVEAAEDLSRRDWEEAPEFSGTGGIERRTLGEKATFPLQRDFYELAGDYEGEMVFQEEDKRVYVVEYSGENSFYEVTVDFLDRQEFLEVFRSMERMFPTFGAVEVLYGDENVFVPPGEVMEYYENEEDFEDQREVYFVGAVSSNSNIDFVRSDTEEQEEEYRLEMTVGGRETYNLDALRPVFSEKMVKGLKTGLELDNGR